MKVLKVKNTIFLARSAQNINVRNKICVVAYILIGKKRDCTQ